MRGFFREWLAIHVELFTDDDWIGPVLGVLIVALELCLLALLYYGVVWMADHAWRPVQEGDGEVVEKDHRQAYTTLTPMMIGKVTVMNPVYHPETWSLHVEVYGQGRDWISVNESFWTTVNRGTPLVVSYDLGRLTDSLNVRNVGLR